MSIRSRRIVRYQARRDRLEADYRARLSVYEKRTLAAEKAPAVMLIPAGRFPHMRLLSMEDLRTIDPEVTSLKNLEEDERRRVEEQMQIYPLFSKT